jgi:hypothetical protein
MYLLFPSLQVQTRIHFSGPRTTLSMIFISSSYMLAAQTTLEREDRIHVKTMSEKKKKPDD